MHKLFDAAALEKKWQKIWAESGLYDVVVRHPQQEKEYVLVEWPYPSGNLHIGHWYAFAVPDIYVRWRKMTGKQVLFPMGFDAFGLPAENAAIKRNINPREWTEQNVAYMRQQLQSMGNAFAWNTTCNSTDPEYYKWTQWMFTEFFRNDLAYRGTGVVNWCPSCHTVIANEQVTADDTCERCGTTIQKKEMPQWMLRITNYADRLVDDLDDLDWPEHIKEAQRQWIGRSRGAEIDFKLSTDDTVTIFTTRPDTLYGATYLVLAPEHPSLEKLQSVITNWSEVEQYCQQAREQDEQDRLDATREKTGVKLEGVTATNPGSGEEIPVYVADYVLGHYGTGAIMAVPAHDERDYAFAVRFNLPIKSVVAPKKITHAGALLEVKGKPGTYLFQKRDANCATNPGKISLFGGGKENDETLKEAVIRELNEELELEITEKQLGNSYIYPSVKEHLYVIAYVVNDVEPNSLILHEGEAMVEMTFREVIESNTAADSLSLLLKQLSGKGAYFTEPGILHSSGEFDGLDSETAKEAIVKKVDGRITNTYRLRDWSIGRQRYWGVPIPIVYDPEGVPHPIPKEHLPWLLPEDVDFTPTGEPPLQKSKELFARTEAIFGEGWTPEVETMDTFVDSSWYFLRYLDPNNNEELASVASQQAWMPIDIYFGGAEHTTMHLLYSRFWMKALFDLGLVKESEPYRRRINRGLILGPDGEKMSKSKGNVVDPDEQVKTVGADAVRMYLAFMGPYEGNNYPFDLNGVVGLRRFLERVNGLLAHVQDEAPESSHQHLHKMIAKVQSDIPQFKFNTAISAMMIALNHFEKAALTMTMYEDFLRVIAPFAPHLTEELWSQRGYKSSIHIEPFPTADPAYLTVSKVTIGVQINGKVRGSVDIAPTADEATAVAAAQAVPELAVRLRGVTITKVIYRPGKILNLVIS